MAKAIYRVAPQDGRWFVRLNEACHGPYSSQDAAVRAAVDAGRKAEAMGYEVAVEIGEDATPNAA